MDVVRNVDAAVSVERKGVQDLKLGSNEGDLDSAWVNIDSDEADSCATSDWDSPASTPPGSPRAPADTTRSTQVPIAADKAAAPASDAKLAPSTPETAVSVVKPAEAAKPAPAPVVAAEPAAPSAPAAPKPAPPAHKLDFDLGKEYFRADLESVQELAKDRTFKVTLRPACPSAKPLCMFIGDAEGKALSMALTGWKWSQQGCRRPLTYDFMRSVVSALGCKLAFVRISASERGVFYARAHFEAAAGTAPTMGDATLGGVDSRPSDALNLALRSGAPVYVHRQLVTMVA